MIVEKRDSTARADAHFIKCKALVNAVSKNTGNDFCASEPQIIFTVVTYEMH
jgi:hypothetical protein